MDPSALLLLSACKQPQPALQTMTQAVKGMSYKSIDGEICSAVRLAASLCANQTRFAAFNTSDGKSCGFHFAYKEARRVVDAYVTKDETIVVEFFGGIHFDHLIASTAPDSMKGEDREAHFGESLAHVFEQIFEPVSLPESFKCSGCQVAKTFLQDWNAAGTQLMQKLNQLTPHWPSSPMVVVGRSFGAPLAVIAAAHLASIGQKPDAVITIVTPRVGNTAFAAHMEGLFPSNYLNLISDRDYVPLLPPLLGDWTHIGTTYSFHRDDTQHEYTIQRCPRSSSLNPFYPCRGKGPDGAWGSATTWLTNHLKEFATKAGILLDRAIITIDRKEGKTDHLRLVLDDPEGFIASGLTQNITVANLFKQLLAPNGTTFDFHAASGMFSGVPTQPWLDHKPCTPVSHAIAEDLTISKCDRKKAGHASAMNTAQCRIEAMEHRK